MDLDDLFNIDIYSFDSSEKNAIQVEILKKLLLKHYDNCEIYRKILVSLGFDHKKISLLENVSDFPYIPVTLFKEFELRSIQESDIFKITTSSGTSGQQVSKIFLDKHNAKIQTKTLSKIVSGIIGKKRLPTIILDSENVLKNRHTFSARAAGIIGFSMFGRDVFYGLDEQMDLKFNDMVAYIEKYRDSEILMYGFTFIIWLHFIKYLVDKNLQLDLSNCVLIHGGGFKKLADQDLTYSEFKGLLFRHANMNKVYDYYGMVEQTGSILTECYHGHLHTNIFNNIFIRSVNDFSILGDDQPGLIEICSLLPSSYPGNLILTEDLGVQLGEDNCLCGKKGKYIKVLGRVKNSEVRGCSDTYEIA